MFLFLSLFLTPSAVLIASAVIPAIWLLIKVYRADRLEPEPPGLILRLVLMGALSTGLAALGEELGARLLGSFLEEGTVLYALIYFFAVVGLCEEGSKYLLLRSQTWRSPEFNCRFDGVVYAVSVSLGFALWENVGYVLRFGLGTAALRAVPAVPGHACFGVFMGVWYGSAKRAALAGDGARSGADRVFAVLVPLLLHGLYDFIACLTGNVSELWFIGFVIVLFLLSLRKVRVTAADDHFF